ncbi:hypothetical protein WJX73_008372 [Symbiochloris irregularis]|uniref:dolichol kinase n=1 Tax=Symbiochloris irregularis TaxID=706552 RepID=A0AAW1NW54_9CHLO
MASHRAVGEAAVIATTVCRVSVCLGLSNRELGGLALALAILCLVAIWQDFKSATRAAERQRISFLGYAVRQASSDGVAVGAIAVPCTLSALLNTFRHTSSSSWALFTLQSSLTASFAMLGLAWMDQGNPQHARNETSYERLPNPEPQQASVDASFSGTSGHAAKRSHVNSSVQEQADDAHALAGDWWQWGLLLAGLALVLSPVLPLTAEASPGSQGHVLEGSHLDGWVQLQPASSRSFERHIKLGVSAVGVAVNASAAAGSLHLMLRNLPDCFTFGEAMVLAQALTYLMTDVLLLMASLMSHRMDGSCIQGVLTRNWQLSGHHIRLPGCQSPAWAPYDVTARTDIGLFVEMLLFAAVVCALIVTPLARSLFSDAAGPAPEHGSDREGTEAAAEASAGWGNQAQGPNRSWQKVAICAKGALLLCLLATAAAVAVRPALLALQYATGTRRRMAVLLSWVAMLAVALPLMDRLARSQQVPTIIVRKGYHILALALFLPALLLEPQLLALSLGIAAAALAAAEILRVGRFPLIGARIHSFMTAFIDSRDCGLLLISHFSLLLGMAAPIWLALPLIASGSDDLSFVSTAQPWLTVIGSCLLEAVTTQLDNIFLPLHHCTLLALG